MTVDPPGQAETTHALDPVFLIAAVASMLLASGVRGPLSAALLGVAIILFPGVLVVRALRPIDEIERILTIVSLSIVGWMLVAHALLTIGWWHPEAVASAALAVFALIRLTEPNRPAPTPFDWRLLAHPQLAVSVTALVLWGWSVHHLDVSDIGMIGLAEKLPMLWFVAFGLAVVGAAHAATSPRTTTIRLVVSVIPVLVVVYGTTALTTSTIRYPWAYKHVGVIRLLDETGRLHPDIDIYNNFSGFFGLFALVRGATGVDPTSYAAWAQLVGEAFVLVAVGYLVHRVTRSVRVAYLAAVLYILTNWVGQNYFAAQTLGSFLSLVTLGLIWSWLRQERRPRSPAAAGEPWTPPRAPTTVDRRLLARRRAAIALVFLGLLMVHPLTPVVVVGAVGAAGVIGWVRDRWLLVALFAVGALWLTRSATYFAAQGFDLDFGGNLFDNAAGNKDINHAPADAALISSITQYFSLTVWLLAAIGGFVASWARRRIGALVLLAVIPFGILLVQSYGGEAIYRVYLYSLPLMTALIAWGIIASAPVDRRHRLPQPTVLASILCLAIGFGFVVVHFGRERINQVGPAEVEMDTYIHEQLEGPALLAQFAGGYPEKSGARYAVFQASDTYTPYIAEMLGSQATLPPPSDLEQVADDLVALTPGTAYVAVSPGMIDELAVLGTFPVRSTAEAADFLASSPRFELVRRIEDTYLFEVLR
ncbi:MAG: hypothetical protein GY713_20210 [Actinomycetia bacterium]|nr:hypothetical protein [Actinomycetes bacterium]